MPSTLEVQLQSLRLRTEQLQDVRTSLYARIVEGLERDGRELRALPAYLTPPTEEMRGEAIVVDTGGTNMRAALVALDGRGRSRIAAGPVKERLVAREGDGATADGFFAEQARLVRQLSPRSGLPAGYCFSYPTEILANRDARLIAWTKGIEIPGVPGTLVGSRLGGALAAAGLGPGRVTVLNDTVASLLGGAFSSAEIPPSRFIGLIVGTGTNMAGFFTKAQAPKLGTLEAAPGERMAINLESGNFSPPHLTPWDEAVDAATDNPGRQRFEKAVSGLYLPYIFARILPGQPGFDPVQGSKTLVDYRDRSLESAPLEVAAALLARSADLVAAALAAVIDFYEGSEPVGILAEGSLFWSDPKYAPRVKATLSTLLGSSDQARIIRLEDANLIGAACAALQP